MKDIYLQRRRKFLVSWRTEISIIDHQASTALELKAAILTVAENMPGLNTFEQVATVKALLGPKGAYLFSETPKGAWKRGSFKERTST